MREQARESLLEIQSLEEEAARAEKLAARRGGSQQFAARKAQRQVERSGTIKRLEAAAASPSPPPSPPVSFPNSPGGSFPNSPGGTPGVKRRGVPGNRGKTGTPGDASPYGML